MGTPSATSRKLRPKVRPPQHNDHCLICKVTKPLHNAHIIPVKMLQLIEDIVDNETFVDYDSYNCMVLCPNHHALFDTGELDKEDFRLIYPRVFAATLLIHYFITNQQRKGILVEESFILQLVAFVASFEHYGQT